MPERMIPVAFLLVYFFLAGCRPSQPVAVQSLDQFEDSITFDYLVYDISLALQWVAPNPGQRWGPEGRNLQVQDNVSTKIVIRLEPKDFVGQDFETALATITAEPVAFETLEDGSRYARSSSPISEYIIYRDFPEFVVSLMLSDQVFGIENPIYVNDWERIALEGTLFVVE